MLLVSVAVATWLLTAGVWTPAFDTADGSVLAYPPGGVEAAAEPLGTPPAVEVPDDTYAFLDTQDDGVTPVAYDPCRPVHYVVRPDGAPPGGAELVAEAFAHVSKLTGLRFVDDGPTDEAPSDDRDPYLPGRYGRRWAPVLVTWTTPDETPGLAGTMLGQAGSSWFQHGGLPMVYVSGSIELDGPELTGLLEDGGRDVVRAVVLHEIGHLVGLGHVDDPAELMYDWQNETVEFGAGDRTGLARLGTGACVPQL